MTVPVRPYRVQKRDWYKPWHLPKHEEEGGLLLSPFFFDYKNVTLFVLGTVLPCRPACIFHKQPMIINSCFTYCFTSRWILSATRQKNLGEQFRLKDSEFESPPKWAIVGSSPSLSFGWVWIPSKECSFKKNQFWSQAWFKDSSTYILGKSI